MTRQIGLIVLTSAMGAGCAVQPAVPTLIPTLPPAAVVVLTFTPPPTFTPVPTPTALPTPGPSPTLAPTETAVMAIQAVGAQAAAVLPTVTQAPAAVVVPPPSADVASAEQYMVDLLNAQRQLAGLAPLVREEALMNVARGRVADMVARGYTGHSDPVTGQPLARAAIQAAGFNSSFVGENWYGSGKPLPTAVEVAMNWFMSDALHRANILSPNFVYLGVGIAHNGQFWLMVQNFAGN